MLSALVFEVLVENTKFRKMINRVQKVLASL
jgi:hypothetical protein